MRRRSSARRTCVTTHLLCHAQRRPLRGRYLPYSLSKPSLPSPSLSLLLQYQKKVSPSLLLSRPARRRVRAALERAAGRRARRRRRRTERSCRRPMAASAARRRRPSASASRGDTPRVASDPLPRPRAALPRRRAPVRASDTAPASIARPKHMGCAARLWQHEGGSRAPEEQKQEIRGRSTSPIPTAPARLTRRS